MSVNMTDPRSTTLIRAWARLMRAQQIALATAEAALKRADLPPLVWYDVLLEVERAGAGGIRPYELERAMLLAQYNLSRLLDRIERDGYIERRNCPHDGRGQVVHITARGKSVRRRMWPVYRRAIEAAIAGRLKPAEIVGLDEILGRIIEPAAGDGVSE